MTSTGFIDKNRHGEAPRDDTDLSEEEDKALADYTPMTKRRVIKEEAKKEVKKLGTWATAFTVFKGFVATGILYMPLNFLNGGYGFSAISIMTSLVMTLYCAHLLLEIHEKVGGGSFPEIGYKIYGTKGKIATDCSLFASQFGFVCAYIYFIGKEMQSVVQCATGSDATNTRYACPDGDLVNKWIFLPICMAIYVPLVFVRKIEKFAPFHLFSDLMIFLTIITICIFAAKNVSRDGGYETAGIQFITPIWPNAIGFSVYAFEGIGVILPIKEITATGDGYFKILCLTVTFISLMYIAFSEYCVFAFGKYDPVTNPGGLSTPLIIDNLPKDDWVVWIIKVLFCFNLVFSYPLVIAPANNVLESYLFAGWPKTRKR